MYRLRVLQIGLAVVICDQITKVFAVTYLENKDSIKILGNFLQLSFARNPGAAFSVATGSTLVFTLLAIAVAIGIPVYANKVRNNFWAVALGGIFGGALGNAIDRLIRTPRGFRGEVVDFINFTHYPLFNLADSAITLSAGLIIWLSFKGIAPRDSDPKLSNQGDS